MTLNERGAIFLHRAPFDQPDVRTVLEGVSAVDDLHAWQTCSQLPVATVHLEPDAETMADAEAVTRRGHAERERHGVDHATVELCPSYAGRAVHLSGHCH